MLQRAVLILSLTSFLVSADVKETLNTNNLNDDWQTLIEQFLAKVKTILQGNDPFNYGGSSSSSNSYGIVFDGSISNLIISGQSTMNVTHLTVEENDPNINLTLGLTFKGLMMTGNYGLYVNVLTLNKLYGNGELGAKISQLGINVTAPLTQVAAANNTLQFEDLIINLDIPQLKIDVTNFMNRPGLSSYANEIVNSIFPTLLSRDGKALSLASSYAKSTLNNLMMQHQINLAVVKDFIVHLIN